MKFLKVAGIIWGFAYFAFGVIMSFTLNSRSGLAFFGATFLLPLPITIGAVWFPKVAGRALLGCVVASFAAVLSDAEYTLSFIGRLLAVTALYNLPLFFFSRVYNMAARDPKGSGKPGETEIPQINSGQYT